MAERYLILRTSALGDIVHALPVLNAIRRQRPEAEVGWVVEESFRSLLDDHPDLTQVIPARFRSWRGRLRDPDARREIAALRRAMREFRPTAVLDLMGNHKSALLAWASGCSVRVGHRRADRREPASALWVNRRVPARGEHAVDRALSILDGLEFEAQEADFAADRLCPGVGPENEQPPILIQPGAGWGNKRYPTAWWGDVAARIGTATGLATGILFGPQEASLAADVSAASEGWAAPAPAADLPRLVGRLRGARLVLGGDTGPVHLAHAMLTPVLCLMGPTDPRRNGPYRTPAATMFTELPCSFCHQRMDRPKACMMALDPASVARRAVALLN